MATQIVISNGDSITVDDNFFIAWDDRGNAMPSLASNIHAVIWNDLLGQNEFQTKDPATGNMTGNTNLNSVDDVVDGTTVQGLLDWGGTRQSQIEVAKLRWEEEGTTTYEEWIAAGNTPETYVFDKTWQDFDTDR
tara:strand:- start:314 stop:718 length:405 start_codon:yes stop_codon:yes gene_type:complete